MMTIIYRISEAGHCPRALVASRLGYEAPPQDKAGAVILKEATRQEDWVVEDMQAEGWKIERGGVCQKCLPDERKGIHVEIESYMLKLIGHLDGRVLLNNTWYPLEIKNLGRFTFQSFKKYGFVQFPDYEVQEAMYLEAEQKLGIYVVRCRDNGERLTYVVPYLGEFIPGYPVLHAKVDVQEIINDLSLAELQVREGQLPTKCTNGKYCPYPYLCDKHDEEPEAVEASTQELVEAATHYREGKELEKQGLDLMGDAKDVFLHHAQQTPKFKVNGVSVSYSGMKKRRYLDEKKVKELLKPDVLEKCYQETKSYPDIRITVRE